MTSESPECPACHAELAPEEFRALLYRNREAALRLLKVKTRGGGPPIDYEVKTNEKGTPILEVRMREGEC